MSFRTPFRRIRGKERGDASTPLSIQASTPLSIQKSPGKLGTMPFYIIHTGYLLTPPNKYRELAGRTHAPGRKWIRHP
jgi:hypothetical protein